MEGAVPGTGHPVGVAADGAHRHLHLPHVPDLDESVVAAGEESHRPGRVEVDVSTKMKTGNEYIIRCYRMPCW